MACLYAVGTDPIDGSVGGGETDGLGKGGENW